jgi:hypothetical protein
VTRGSPGASPGPSAGTTRRRQSSNGEGTTDSCDGNDPLTAADWRRLDDDWRAIEADYARQGDIDSAEIAKWEADVRAACAHLADLGADIDLEAVKAAHRPRPTRDDGDTATPSFSPCEALNLPDDFWTERETLTHIRQAAHARNRSADAVFGTILARMAAATPPTIQLPPVVGAESPLTTYAALVGGPGVGKTSSARVGGEVLPIPPERQMNIAPELPIGSGEGLIEALFDWIEEPGKGGTMREKKVRAFDGAFVFIDEGQVLADLAARNGSTLLPTLRTAWSGAQTGSANATRERKRLLAPMTYAYGIVIGVRETKAGPLLADRDAGTPQRFIWLRATDPNVPDRSPEWPGPLRWHPPDRDTLVPLRIEYDGPTAYHLDVDSSIVAEIHAADTAQVRGELTVNDLDSHGRLIRLRLAALLALLEERISIRPDDWELAGIVKATSDTVRSHIVNTLRERDERQETATSRRLAHRRLDSEEAVERRNTVTAAKRIATIVHTEGPRLRREVRGRLTSTQRTVVELAIDHAVAEGWIAEGVEDGQGANKRTLHPGDRRPR